MKQSPLTPVNVCPILNFYIPPLSYRPLFNTLIECPFKESVASCLELSLPRSSCALLALIPKEKKQQNTDPIKSRGSSAAALRALLALIPFKFAIVQSLLFYGGSSDQCVSPF